MNTSGPEQFKDTPTHILLMRNVARVVEALERQQTFSLEMFIDALNTDARYPRAGIRISRYCRPDRVNTWYTELIVTGVWSKDAGGWYKQTYVVSDHHCQPAAAMPWRSTIKTSLLRGIDFEKELQEIQHMDREHKAHVTKKEGK